MKVQETSQKKSQPCTQQESYPNQQRQYQNTQKTTESTEQIKQKSRQNNQNQLQQQQDEDAWSLFDSLNCKQCGKMYNNKQRKPQIICANNHILCKACFTKIKQSSHSCPFCSITLNKSSTSQHHSIQSFLKIYNQIYQSKKNVLDDRRRQQAQKQNFMIPKNLKKIIILLFILVLPWIIDSLLTVTDFFISLQKSILQFMWYQVNDVIYVIRTVIEDIFYITLYTNENGQYVYYGDEILNEVIYGKNQNSQQRSQYESLYTNKHKARIEVWVRLLGLANTIISKIFLFCSMIWSMLYVWIYGLHFVCIIVAIIQFPLFLPIILQSIQFHIICFKIRYRLNIYIDILDSYQIQYGFSRIQSTDIDILSKFQLYTLLVIRNYIETVLKFQQEMKKKAQDFQQRKKIRESNKKRKENLKNKDKQHKMKFTF